MRSDLRGCRCLGAGEDGVVVGDHGARPRRRRAPVRVPIPVMMPSPGVLSIRSSISRRARCAATRARRIRMKLPGSTRSAMFSRAVRSPVACAALDRTRARAASVVLRRRSSASTRSARTAFGVGVCPPAWVRAVDVARLDPKQHLALADLVGRSPRPGRAPGRPQGPGPGRASFIDSTTSTGASALHARALGGDHLDDDSGERRLELHGAILARFRARALLSASPRSGRRAPSSSPASAPAPARAFPPRSAGPRAARSRAGPARRTPLGAHRSIRPRSTLPRCARPRRAVRRRRGDRPRACRQPG